MQTTIVLNSFATPAPIPLIPLNLNKRCQIQEVCKYPYEKQYKKNLEMIKLKYRNNVNPDISFEEVMSCFRLLDDNNDILKEDLKNQIYWKKVYCFLCSLAFYETDGNKFHDFFNESEWNNFAESVKLLTKEEVMIFRKEIFKQNLVNYKWTDKEDLLLKSIVLKNQQTNEKIAWQQVAIEFNQFSFLSQQLRTSAHCQERWKNTLRLSFKRGEWSKEQDLMILKFVIDNGTKWSKLAKIFCDRTEHNVKNRFFSILSKYLTIPIRKIKRTVNYCGDELLSEVMKQIQMESL